MTANGEPASRKPMRPEECDTLLLEALEAGDLDACVALYEPMAVLFSKSGGFVTGLDAIRDSFAAMIALEPRFVTEFVKSAMNGDGSLATNRMKAAMEWRDKEGKARTSQLHSLEVVRRQPDGSWRFAIDDPYGSMRDSLKEA